MARTSDFGKNAAAPAGSLSNAVGDGYSEDDRVLVRSHLGRRFCGVCVMGVRGGQVVYFKSGTGSPVRLREL